MDLTLDAEFEGGTVRVYRGSSTQSRSATGDPYQTLGMNYRNVCWALYGAGAAYKMGRNASPKSHSWIIYRLPSQLRTDATTFSALVQRGSASSSHVNYTAANPVAIIWEALVNDTWGAGIDSAFLDETTFQAESEFFRDENIGANFIAGEQESIEDFIGAVMQQFKLIMVWDNLSYKIKCLMNPATTHGTINTLRKSEIDGLSFNRPDWNTVINEVRAEFIDAERGWRGNVVDVKDMGSIAQQGGVVTTNRVSLTAKVTDFNTARRLATRILNDSAYPLGSITFKVNRFKSQIEVGDVFRLVWDEFNSGTVTGYWMVVSRKGDDGADDAIEIQAVEDIFIPAVGSEELSVTTPVVQGWNEITDTTLTQVGLATDVPLDEAELTPIKAFEFPPMATQGQRAQVVLLAQRTSSSVLSIQYNTNRRNKSPLAVRGSSRVSRL